MPLSQRLETVEQGITEIGKKIDVYKESDKSELLQMIHKLQNEIKESQKAASTERILASPTEIEIRFKNNRIMSVTSPDVTLLAIVSKLNRIIATGNQVITPQSFVEQYFFTNLTKQRPLHMHANVIEHKVILRTIGVELGDVLDIQEK